MRSTTWSTVTNVFIISTVALLSLIPAADAYSPPALGTVKIISPAAGDVYQAGESAMVKWVVNGSADGGVGNLTLANNDNGQTWILKTNVPIQDNSTSVTYLEGPGNNFQILFDIEAGNQEYDHASSGAFTIDLIG